MKIKSKHIRRGLIVSVCILLSLFSFSSYAEEVWIDVRTTGEYERDHIEGDVLIPHSSISRGIQNLGLEKDSDIYLYCAAGIRAEMAKNALLKLGYTNVHNVGGIKDARRLRKE